MNVPTNALLALAAAASWGGGDFSGGTAVKATGGTVAAALRVVIAAHALSLIVLLCLLACSPQHMPHGALLLWGMASGLAAAFAITAFYIALSRAAMGASAAVSGLLAAAIPALLSSVLEGVPTLFKLIGFALAAAAIWMIAAGPSPENTPEKHHRITMALAIFSGLGFGFYFIALRMDNPLGNLMPMAIARATSLTLCIPALLFLQRRPNASPHDKAFLLNSTAILGVFGVALLDTGGNILFIVATRAGRLDVAAVLASLYPAVTILLAAWFLHERPTRRQLLGMSVALAAVVIITL